MVAGQHTNAGFRKHFRVRSRQRTNRIMLHVWSGLPSLTVWSQLQISVHFDGQTTFAQSKNKLLACKFRVDVDPLRCVHHAPVCKAASPSLHRTYMCINVSTWSLSYCCIRWFTDNEWVMENLLQCQSGCLYRQRTFYIIYIYSYATCITPTLTL